MIDKVLKRQMLYVSIPDRYPQNDNGDLYRKKDSGLFIPEEKNKDLPVPFEIAEVLQVGAGKTEEGIEMEKLYKKGDKVRIFPRRGADFNLGEKGWVTFINEKDVISIL